MSTSFALAIDPSDSNCLLDAWLSISMFIGSAIQSSISMISSRNTSNSRRICEAEMNSASMFDNDTPVCFVQIHCTIVPLTVSTPPVTDFRCALSASNSESLRLVTVIAYFFASIFMCIFMSLIAFKYLAMRDASCQPLTLSWCVRLVALCTAKLMSGLVHRAIQSSLPTSDWKC